MYSSTNNTNPFSFHHPDLFVSDFLWENYPVIETNISGTAVSNYQATSTGLNSGHHYSPVDLHPRKKPGKKDRHTKINTAKGLRDRRVRLSIDIARKFFDLQEMLGFDTASKTLDWLLTNSKEDIKELMEVSSTDGEKSLSQDQGAMQIVERESREKAKEKKMITKNVGEELISDTMEDSIVGDQRKLNPSSVCSDLSSSPNVVENWEIVQGKF